MKIEIFCPYWGMEDIPFERFLENVKEAGFDGVEIWLPEKEKDIQKVPGLLEAYKLKVIAHQHQAEGKSIAEFCNSLGYYLQRSLELNPVRINSHSGRDYFRLEEQLRVLDAAFAFSAQTGMPVFHETHRGRIGFSPYNFQELFLQRPEIQITADFSHWTCVTESLLQHQEPILQQAINRSFHIHARVGYEEGPQVPDPRLPLWAPYTVRFFEFWKRIVQARVTGGDELLTITTEFGPPPYMWISPESGKPVNHPFELNCYMKSLLREAFADFL